MGYVAAVAKVPPSKDNPTDCKILGSQYRAYDALEGSITIQQINTILMQY